MRNLIEYKGYVGSVEFSPEDELFYGKVQGIRALISYEGANAAELVQDFHGAVDDYLELCREEGKGLKGHTRDPSMCAFLQNYTRRLPSITMEHDVTLNKFVEQAVENQLAMVY